MATSSGNRTAHTECPREIDWEKASKAMRKRYREAFADLPPRPEVSDEWKRANKDERRKIMNRLCPEEPAMCAIRVDIDSIVESKLQDIDKMGEFYSHSLIEKIPPEMVKQLDVMRKHVHFATDTEPCEPTASTQVTVPSRSCLRREPAQDNSREPPPIEI